MCPFCIATAALLAAGATSAVGLGSLAVMGRSRLRAGKTELAAPPPTPPSEAEAGRPS